MTAAQLGLGSPGQLAPAVTGDLAGAFRDEGRVWQDNGGKIMSTMYVYKRDKNVKTVCHSKSTELILTRD